MYTGGMSLQAQPLQEQHHNTAVKEVHAKVSQKALSTLIFDTSGENVVSLFPFPNWPEHTQTGHDIIPFIVLTIATDSSIGVSATGTHSPRGRGALGQRHLVAIALNIIQIHSPLSNSCVIQGISSGGVAETQLSTHHIGIMYVPRV